MVRLKGAWPAGSLQEANVNLWRAAGYRVRIPERSLIPLVDDDDLDLILLRSQEIPRYVARGDLDFGIAGRDWIFESGCEKRVVELGNLAFSKRTRRPVRWVFLVREDAPLRDAWDLRGKTVATELVRVTRKWFSDREIAARVEFSWGATEVKPGRLCDAIVDAVETGASIREHGLRIIEELLTSVPLFIANRKAYANSQKREKMEDIYCMLQGALNAEGVEMLALNAPRTSLDAVLGLIPALHAPTVANLACDDWLSVTATVDAAIVRSIVPRLKRAGAQDIVVYPITKMVR